MFLNFAGITKVFAVSEIKILSWNVYMLPTPIKWSLQKERTQAITEQLIKTNHDLIFFQEAFTQDFREFLSKKLNQKYPFTYYLDSNGDVLNLFGSGLFLMSRHPFKLLDHVYFDECSGFDCFSSKGAFLVEIIIPPNKTLQLSNTHLQAGQNSENIRAHQLKQIKSMFVKNNKKNYPQLLVGDLNINFLVPEFQKALELTEMNYAPLANNQTNNQTTNARVNDCYSTPQTKMWIDHAWISKPTQFKKFEIQIIPSEFNFNTKTCPSSDHQLLEISLYGL